MHWSSKVARSRRLRVAAIAFAAGILAAALLTLLAAPNAVVLLAAYGVLLGALAIVGVVFMRSNDEDRGS